MVRLLILLVAGVCVVPGDARADDCDTMVESMVSIFRQPYASAMAIAVPGQEPDYGQSVFAGGKLYVQVNGSWRLSPLSAQETIDHMRQTQRQSNAQCQRLGAEPLNGTAATIFTMHTKTEQSTNDSRVWIADDTGLPLKSETRFENGMIVSQSFRYDDIRAPTIAE